jgi:glyoxylase-like metal-dependent hydrolase (beta-lactamase superfamily II)
VGDGVVLHPILSGEIRLDVIAARPPRRGPAKLPRTLLGSMRRKAQWYPTLVFLVEHPTAGPFLIDVGYDPSIADDPTRTLGHIFGKLAMQHRLADRDVTEAVAERGVDPANVKLVVMTHLHLDHTSAAGQWQQATFLVDRIERKAARRPGPGPYVRSHLATIERWREVNFNGPEAEPFESFSRTIDLFGDGSVRLVSSPGHSPGHLSVLLQLADRYALVMGDSAMTTRELRERLVDGVIINQDAYLRSGDEARDFYRAHPGTLAIPSHDREVWAGLEPIYR